MAKPARKEAAAGHVATVRLSAVIRDRAKIQAAKERRSIQAVLDQAVDEYLKKRGA